MGKTDVPGGDGLHQAVLGNIYYIARREAGAAGVILLPGPFAALCEGGEPALFDVLGFVGDTPEGNMLEVVPAFAAEVVSKGTYKDDAVTKKRLCAEAGVPEFWIADPRNEVVTVCAANGDTRDENIYGRGEAFVSAALGGVLVSVDEIFGFAAQGSAGGTGRSHGLAARGGAQGARGGAQGALPEAAAALDAAVDKPRDTGALFVTQYTAEDVRLYQERDGEVTRLFAVAEQTCGCLLSHADQNMYLGFYDDLGLPVDVIQVLLQYCIDKRRTSKAYIKAVAQDWAKRGIATIEEAEAYIDSFENGYREIFRAFGLGRKTPAPVQIEYMDRWLNEYAMPVETIVMACEKTILAIAEPKFEYAEAIIRKWREGGVSAPEEIEALDNAFYENLKVEKRKRRSKADGGGEIQVNRQKRSRFYNYKGREWDYEKLERMEQAYQEQVIAKDK